MALPTFVVGQRVSVSEMGRLTAPRGLYNIVRALPASPGPALYRIKSDTESFERIIDGGRLTAINDV